MPLEFRRRHPVGECAHVLGGQAVGTHERELLEVLEAGRVDDDAVLASRAACPSRRPDAVSSAASARKSDSKNTRSKAIPSRASVLRCPAITQARVLYQSSSASRSPASTRFSSSSAVSLAHRQLARHRVFGVLDLGAAERSGGGDVLGVAEADEVVALLVAVRPGVLVPAAVEHARHRLAHAAAASEIRLRRSTCGPRLCERRGQRVADREIAQVADVQRLGRVRVPELDREAPAVRKVRERRLARRRPQRRRPSLRSSRRRGAVATPSLVRAHRSTHGSASIRSSTSSESASSRQSAERGTSLRSKRALGRRGAQAAQRTGLRPAAEPLRNSQTG